MAITGKFTLLRLPVIYALNSNRLVLAFREQAPANNYNLGIAFLKVNKTAADRYKQANPSKFEGTVAPSAVVACADPTEFALGQEGVEMATAQFIPSAQGEIMKREY